MKKFIISWTIIQLMAIIMAVEELTFPPIVIPGRFQRKSVNGCAFFGIVIFLRFGDRKFIDIRTTLFHEFRHTWQFWHHPLVYMWWICHPSVSQKTYGTYNAIERDARAYARSGRKRGMSKILTLSYARRVAGLLD